MRDIAYKSTIESLRKKLSAYETLEMDIDAEVERVGKEDGSFDDGKLLFQIARNPDRRIHQAITLAHRLVETQKQRDEALRIADEVKSHNIQLEDTLAKTKEDLARVGQPTGYLVMKLREEEALKTTWMQKHRELEGEMSRLSQDHECLKLEVDQLHEKLSSLLKQREEIRSLRELVEAWQQAQEEVEEDFESSQPHIEEVFQSKSISADIHADVEGKVEDEVSFAELGLSPDLVRRMLTPPSQQRPVQ